MRFLLILSILSTVAVAQPKPKKAHWAEHAMAGDCNEDNTFFIENGDALSVLYEALSVTMPLSQTGDGLEAKRQCQFRIEIDPPPGMYLAQVRQLYSGGLIKSLRSAAKLVVRYRLGTYKERPFEKEWRQNQAIPPESPLSLFSEVVEDTIPFEQCRKRNRLAVTLVVNARRQSLNEYVVGGFDSTDLELVHKVKLIPYFRPCR